MRKIISLASFLLTGNAYAETLAAHEHGKAQLNVALSAAALNIELIAPANSFWGFEYAAKTPEEQAAKLQALTTLKSASWLSLPELAGCNRTSSSAANSADAEHDDDHDHEHHVAHDEKAQASQETSIHTDVVVSLEFTCAKPDELMPEGVVSLRLFQAFPGINTVSLQAITDSGQLAKTLSLERATFGLGQAP